MHWNMGRPTDLEQHIYVRGWTALDLVEDQRPALTEHLMAEIRRTVGLGPQPEQAPQ